MQAAVRASPQVALAVLATAMLGALLFFLVPLFAAQLQFQGFNPEADTALEGLPAQGPDGKAAEGGAGAWPHACSTHYTICVHCTKMCLMNDSW